MRISKQHIENLFKAWCHLNNYKVAESYNDMGALRVDKGIGGYNIELIISTGGGVSHPFGPYRRSATEFSEFLHSMIIYLHQTQQNAVLFKFSPSPK